MAELKVKDVMSREVFVLSPSTPVKEAAKLLAEKKIGGAPVVEGDKLVGIVSEADLIMQDVKIHFPTYLHLLDGFIYLESLKKFETELKKAVGAKVEDLMTKDVICTDEEASVEEVATLMVEEGISRLPVTKEGKVVGMVTKGDLVKAISQS